MITLTYKQANLILRAMSRLDELTTEERKCMDHLTPTEMEPTEAEAERMEQMRKIRLAYELGDLGG